MPVLTSRQQWRPRRRSAISLTSSNPTLAPDSSLKKPYLKSAPLLSRRIKSMAQAKPSPLYLLVRQHLPKTGDIRCQLHPELRCLNRQPLPALAVCQSVRRRARLAQQCHLPIHQVGCSLQKTARPMTSERGLNLPHRPLKHTCRQADQQPLHLRPPSKALSEEVRSLRCETRMKTTQIPLHL